MFFQSVLHLFFISFQKRAVEKRSTHRYCNQCMFAAISLPLLEPVPVCSGQPTAIGTNVCSQRSAYRYLY